MPGRPLNLIPTNLPRPWSPRESSPSGKIVSENFDTGNLNDLNSIDVEGGGT